MRPQQKTSTLATTLARTKAAGHRQIGFFAHHVWEVTLGKQVGVVVVVVAAAAAAAVGVHEGRWLPHLNVGVECAELVLPTQAHPAQT